MHERGVTSSCSSSQRTVNERHVVLGAPARAGERAGSGTTARLQTNVHGLLLEDARQRLGVGGVLVAEADAGEARACVGEILLATEEQVVHDGQSTRRLFDQPVRRGGCR